MSRHNAQTLNTPLDDAEGLRSPENGVTGTFERTGQPELRVVSRDEYARLQAEQIRLHAADRRARRAAKLEPPGFVDGRRESPLSRSDVGAVKALMQGGMERQDIADRIDVDVDLLQRIHRGAKFAYVVPWKSYRAARAWLRRFDRDDQGRTSLPSLYDWRVPFGHRKTGRAWKGDGSGKSKVEGISEMTGGCIGYVTLGGRAEGVVALRPDDPGSVWTSEGRPVGRPVEPNSRRSRRRARKADVAA